jgi:hypothetical protein
MIAVPLRSRLEFVLTRRGLVSALLTAVESNLDCENTTSFSP